MSDPSTKDAAKSGHPIRVVANRTGLSPHVIRIWERRYGAVKPQRTDTNRRLYSDDDVVKLRLLHEATEAGRGIGQVADLSIDELEALVAEDRAASPRYQRTAPPSGNAGEDFLASALQAVELLDSASLQNVLMRASLELSQPALVNVVIVPLMEGIGDMWREGRLRVAHEHLASAVVRTFLGNLKNAFKTSAAAPMLVVGTPAGQLHELGALIVAANAAADGWRVTYLGPNLPAEELAAAAHQHNAAALAMSVIYPADDPQTVVELEKLAELLPDDISVVLGGRSAQAYVSRMRDPRFIVLHDIDALRTHLQTIRPA